MDLNASHYSKDELTQLLGLSANPDKITILNAVSDKISKLTNPDYIQFYKDAETQLIDSLPTTDTNNVYNADVQRGNLNPDLKNTVQRMVNIDSFYRDTIGSNNYGNDNFTFQLDEPITNVISFYLYSIELPQSWYTFTYEKGTVAFRLIVTDMEIESGSYIDLDCAIHEGNYTSQALMYEVAITIQNKIRNATFTDPSSNVYLENCTCIIQQSPYTGRITILINNIGFDPVTPTNPNPDMRKFLFQFIWFDSTFTNPDMRNNTINNNLGWILGFRTYTTIFKTIPISENIQQFDASNQYLNTPFDYFNGFQPPIFFGEIVDMSGSVFSHAPSIIDTGGTKYVILRLDDYKTNRLNHSLITINTSPSLPIPLPSYYNTTLPQYNISETQIHTQATAPRNLTAAQIFTINSISVKNSITIKQRMASPNNSDIFAKIPIKKTTDWGIFEIDASGIPTYSAIDGGPAKLLIEFSGPLQLNIREYFGPVNILGFTISLYDDRGNLLGLNGVDWSCTLMVKSLYQY